MTKQLIFIGGRRAGMSTALELLMAEAKRQGIDLCRQFSESHQEMIDTGRSMMQIKVVEEKVEVRHIPLEQWQRKGKHKRKFP